MGKGSENELPREVYAALPNDPEQQLEVAQQITQIAVSGRVAKLEADCNSLRQKVAEKDAVIGGLQARVAGAETTLAETAAKLAVALEEQARLIEDKNELTGQVQKLMCQVSKLDEFKKALMKALETSTECRDDVVGDGSTTVSSSSASSSRPITSCESQPPSPMSKSTEAPTPTKRKQQGQFSCMTPEKPPPKSAAGRASNSEDAESGASDDGASSKQSAFGPRTPRTPPDDSPAKSPRIAGKELFRQARSRLTYEQFSEFLSNVKELNAHRRDKMKAAQASIFHPMIYSCTTDVPPNYGDWVLISSKVAS